MISVAFKRDTAFAVVLTEFMENLTICRTEAKYGLTVWATEFKNNLKFAF